MTRIEVWEAPIQSLPVLSGLFEGAEPDAWFWAENYADEIRLRWARRHVDGQIQFVKYVGDSTESGCWIQRQSQTATSGADSTAR